MQNSDETKIYEETGCLFSCDKFAYELTPTGPLERDDYIFYALFPEFETISDILHIDLYFKTGDYMEYEQVRMISLSFLTMSYNKREIFHPVQYLRPEQPHRGRGRLPWAPVGPQSTEPVSRAGCHLR